MSSGRSYYRRLRQVGLAVFLGGEAVLGTLAFSASPASAAPVTVNVCSKAGKELDLNNASNANSKAKLINPAYFGTTGTVAPETLNFISLASVTSATLSSNNCQIYLGGGSLNGSGNDDLTAAEVTAVTTWLTGSGHFLLAGCDYAGQSSQICSAYRTMTNISNGSVTVNSVLSYNPLTCGGTSGVQTFGGVSSSFTTQAGDSVLATHNANGSPAAITDNLVTPKFLFTGDADMYASSGSTAIGTGATATSNQAKFLVNSFKFALDGIMGRLGNPQCFASYDQKADLALSLSTTNASPAVGGQTTVTITVTNQGPSNVTGVTAIATLPSGFTLAGQSGTGSYSTSTQAWSIGSLANGASASITLTLDVNSAGSFSIPAQITQSSLADIDSSTNVGFGVDDLGDGIADDDEASVVVNASLPPSLSGNIFDDADGSKIKAASGEDYTAAIITAVLLDASNKVVSTAAVDGTGNYTLNNVSAGTYSVKIIQTPGTALTAGAVIPPANDILPTNWVATGENNNGTPDATVDRTQSVTVASANITNINFGIEQLPDTTALNPASQTNPGGTATAQVPTLAGTDPEDGALGSGKSFKIVTLPTNADLYYNGTKITTPNFAIANYDPTKLLVDPNDGTVTVSFTYAVVDAAGQQDSTPATVTMPFTAAVVTPPNLLLIKRITAINGLPLNVYKDDTASTSAADDNNINWPTPLNTNAGLGDTTISTFLRGAIDGGKVKPGDTIEYTIYFLNAGGSNATNVRVCDRIIDSQKFLSGSSIQLQKNNAIPTALTSEAGDDRATFYSSSSDPAITNCNFTGTPTQDNGAIVVDVTGASNPVWTTLLGSTGPGTTDTYGFVRFTTKVNP